MLCIFVLEVAAKAQLQKGLLQYYLQNSWCLTLCFALDHLVALLLSNQLLHNADTARMVDWGKQNSPDLVPKVHFRPYLMHAALWRHVLQVLWLLLLVVCVHQYGFT
jgi:hypothetical protein